MALNGPVRPARYYLNPIAAPQPAGSFAIGEIITCPGTGRMWVAKSETAGDVSQILPYVRTDDGASGIRVINTSGDMVFERPSGATGGQVNLLNNLFVTPTGIRFNGLNQNSTAAGTLCCKPRTGGFDGSVFVVESPLRYVLAADVTLGTSPTVLADLTFTVPSTETYTIPYLFRLNATFQHDNQFTVHVGLVRYISASNYGTQVSTTIHSQQGNYVQANLELFTNLLYSPAFQQRIEVVAWADVAGVKAKQLPGSTAFPEAVPVLSVNSATYMNIQRIG